jgi:Spy/CpxP family protein refolding chaperone
MKRISLVPVMALCCYLLFMPMQKLHAQSGAGAQKFEQLATQLNLTPEQKAQLVPILVSEAPKVEAIRTDSSLSRIQKLQQLKAVHDQIDPQVRSILTPEQYQKLKEIRRQEIEQGIRRRQNQ